MIFDLVVYREVFDGTDTNEEIVTRHANVDVQWGAGHVARACRHDGVQVAAVGTWDDYPIDVEADCVRISGTLRDHPYDGEPGGFRLYHCALVPVEIVHKPRWTSLCPGCAAIIFGPYMKFCHGCGKPIVWVVEAVEEVEA